MHLLRRVVSGTSVAVLSLSTLLTMGFTGVAHAAVQTCSWTGAGADDKFSTVANWSGCGAGAPQAGDIISFNSDVFPDANSAELTNDLTVALGGVQTTKGTIANSVYSVQISSLKMADGAIIDATNGSNGELGISVATSSAGGSILGPIISTGSVTVKGDVNARYLVDGTLTLENNDPLNSAFAYMDDTSEIGTLKIGDRMKIRYAPAASISLKVIPFPIQFVATTSSIDFEAYCTQWQGMSCLSSDPITYTQINPITLAGDTAIEVGSGVTLNITGTITGGKLTKSAESSGTLNIGETTVTQPVKTTECSDKQSLEHTNVAQNETYILRDGCERAGIIVYSGGVIKGTGAKISSLSVNKGATVAPGMSPGCISSTTLSLFGTYQFELGGTDACTGYDQLKVTDTTQPSSTVTFGSESLLTTSRYNDYTPTQGQVFTIIDVAGTQAVTGTFKDLPEGATFTQNGVVFKISYVGGTGNDVTLTVQNQPTAPDTGFALITANPLVTLGLTASAAAILFALARRMRPVHVRATTRRK